MRNGKGDYGERKGINEGRGTDPRGWINVGPGLPAG